MEISPETEDALDSCQSRVAAARKEADKSKSAIGMRQSVRQDMRLRAKVPTLLTRDLPCNHKQPKHSSACSQAAYESLGLFSRTGLPGRLSRALSASAVCVTKPQIGKPSTVRCCRREMG